MEVADYIARTAADLAVLVADGELTPEELAAAATARHEQTHDAINAVVEWYDPAPAGAERPTGPLAGVPTLRKDFGSTEAGRLVEMGSRLAVGLVAEETSPFFQRLDAAGAQVLGRTAVPEFAQHATTESYLCGPTRNPLDGNNSAGGSSGGAAAAVAAGVVPFAHASDAAGSIRIPAAVTGLIGLKPTNGSTPAPNDDWRGLVSEFVIARSHLDVELAFSVLTGRQVAPTDGKLTVAISHDHWASFPIDPAISKAADRMALTLERHLHRVDVTPPPVDYERLMSLWFPLFGRGVADGVHRVAAETGRPIDGDHLEPNTLETLDRVAALSPASLEEATATRAAVTAELDASLGGIDILVTPTLDRRVVPLGRIAGDCPLDRYLVEGDEWFDRLYLANVTGWPALTLPAPNVVGPPIGVQFMARPGREDHLFRIARDLMSTRSIPPVTPH